MHPLFLAQPSESFVTRLNLVRILFDRLFDVEKPVEDPVED